MANAPRTPHIPLTALTPDEKRLVEAALRDEEFVGHAIQYRTQTKPVPNLEGQEENPPRTFEFREYQSGGTDVRCLVLEDLALGKYGELPRIRLRAQFLRLTSDSKLGTVDLGDCAELPALVLQNCCARGILLTRTGLSALNLKDSLIGEDGLNAENAKFDHDCEMENAQIEGSASIFGSVIGGQLNCRGCKFVHPGEKCLHAYSLHVTGHLFLDRGFQAHGTVYLDSSRIDGGFQCTDGKFLHQGENCFRAFGLDVKGTMFLDGAFEARGVVDINSTEIAGDLICSGAKFLKTKAIGLSAFAITVGGNLFMNSKFKAKGSIDLNNSEIKGGLELLGSKLGSFNGVSLRADGLQVSGNTTFDADFEATGDVNLQSASLGSLLVHGKIQQLSLEDAKISQTLTVGTGARIETLVLTEAFVGKFDDQYAVSGTPSTLSPRQCWFHVVASDFIFNRPTWPRMPYETLYKMAGFRVDALDPQLLEPANSRTFGVLRSSDYRLAAWIENSDDGAHLSATYEMFSDACNRGGHPELAKYLNIAKNRHRRKAKSILRRTVERLFLDIPIAYGYRPIQAFYIALLMWVFVWYAAAAAFDNGLIVPSGENRSTAEKLVAPKSGTHTASVAPPIEPRALAHTHGPGFVEFSPGAYAFDSVVPLISFKQRDNWAVEASSTSPSLQPGSVLRWAGWTNWGQVAQWVQWMLTVMGWVLATLFVSAFTGLIRNKY